MSQKQRLLNLLSDCEWHSTIEICDVVYGYAHAGLARVGARIWELRKAGHTIEGKHDKDRQTIYHYRLVPKPTLDTRQQFTKMITNAAVLSLF